MIRKYTIGNPFETGAIPEKPETSALPVPYLTAVEDGFTYKLGEKDAVYGLGQQVRGIDKRGWLYVSSNVDDPDHLESKHSLYAAHNFLIVSGEKLFGVFFDTPCKVTFDIAYTTIDEMRITFAEMNMDLYIIDGESEMDIVKQYRKLIGRSYIAPKWALGFSQCRWSYMSEDEIREVVRNYRERHIPLDLVYMDIDYMDHYKDFTINEETFPDFENFVKEMREQHIHLVPIIDAAIKVEEGFDVYDEGHEKGYFLKDEDGEDFVVGVWPGRSVFPDMLNPEAADWFGEHYKFLLDKGVDAFWNDMNEPSIFYSEKHLMEFFRDVDEYKKMNLDAQTFFDMKEEAIGLSQNPEDHKRFYHNINGEKIRHDRVHNLFGYKMTKAASDAFERLVPDKRVLMFSRSSYTGMHRYGGIWYGDNCSFWSHILLNLKMAANVNMTGFLYSGADIGGFGADSTPDLLLRWTEFGIYLPLFRNHSSRGTRYHEAYRFERNHEFRDIISVRYALLPYIYSEYMKAVLKGEMYAAPLAFVYPDDPRARKVEDQLMIGGSLMVAPVYEQNAAGRFVYLPEDMKMIRLRSPEDYDEVVLAKGDHYIDIALNETVFFIPKGCAIPFAKAGEYVTDIDFDTLRGLSFSDEPVVYELYDDDGASKDYDLEKNTISLTICPDGTVAK